MTQSTKRQFWTRRSKKRRKKGKQRHSNNISKNSTKYEISKKNLKYKDIIQITLRNSATRTAELRLSFLLLFYLHKKRKYKLLQI